MIENHSISSVYFVDLKKKINLKISPRVGKSFNEDVGKNSGMDQRFVGG